MLTQGLPQRGLILNRQRHREVKPGTLRRPNQLITIKWQEINMSNITLINTEVPVKLIVQINLVQIVCNVKTCETTLFS